MKKFVEKLLKNEHLSLRGQIIKGAGGVFILKAISTVLGFITGVLLARLLGAEGLGIYAYVFALIGFLSIPFGGVVPFMTREISIYFSQKRWQQFKGVLTAIVTFVLVGSLVISLSSLLISKSFKETNTLTIEVFMYALLTIPLGALMNIFLGTMRGLKKVVLAFLPTTIFSPFIFVVLLITFYLLKGIKINIVNVVKLSLFSQFFTIFLCIWIILKNLPREIFNVSSTYKLKKWIFSILSLGFISGLQVIMNQTDIIMLKMFKSSKLVGIYSISNGLSGVVSFSLILINQAFAPIVAELIASQNKTKLQKEVTFMARLTFIFALLVFLTFLALGKFILSIYGKEFTEGYSALTILSLSHLINVAAGPVGMLLAMGKYEREIIYGLSIATIINIFGNFILIPNLGIVGASIATGLGLATWNIILAYAVKRRLGIYSYAFRLG